MVRDPGQTLRRSGWTTCRPRADFGKRGERVGKRGDPERGGPAVNAAGIVRAEYDPAPSRAGVVGHTGATSYELWRCSDTKAQKERAKAGLAITGAALTIAGGWKVLHGVKATATAIKLGLPVAKIALKKVGVEIGEGVVEEYVKEFFLETVQSSCLGYWEPLTGYNVRMETYTDANYIVGTTYTDDVSPQRYYYYRVRGQHRNGPGPWSDILSHIQPGVPNLSVLELTETSVTLVWTNVGGNRL